MTDRSIRDVGILRSHALRKSPIAVEIGTGEPRRSAVKKSCRESVRSLGRRDPLSRRPRLPSPSTSSRCTSEFSVSNETVPQFTTRTGRAIASYDALINNPRACIISLQRPFWVLTRDSEIRNVNWTAISAIEWAANKRTLTSCLISVTSRDRRPSR